MIKFRDNFRYNINHTYKNFDTPLLAKNNQYWLYEITDKANGKWDVEMLMLNSPMRRDVKQKIHLTTLGSTKAAKAFVRAHYDDISNQKNDALASTPKAYLEAAELRAKPKLSLE